MKTFLPSPNKYSHWLQLRLPPLASLFHTSTLSSSSSQSYRCRQYGLSWSSSQSYKCRQYGLSSSSLSTSQLYKYRQYRLSSSSDKYQHFFPCYYNEYLSDIIDWRLSKEAGLDQQRLYNPNKSKSLDMSRMAFPCLEDEPHYTHIDFDHHVNDNEPILIRKGHHFDVISLLSTYSDYLVRVQPNNNKTDFVKANNLRGKYVLLFCGSLPCLWIGGESQLWRKLSLLSSELSQTHVGSNFEIVIVGKLRKGWDDDEGVFNHSLSAFSGCLAVPFSHKSRRDYILKSVDFDGELTCVLVDPSHEVLMDCFEFIVKFGARGFPFTSDHNDSLCHEDCWDKSCHLSNKTLAGLLSCGSDPSSFLLHKLDSEETISVEQLNKKLVGLYLFRDGTMLNSIHKMYQQCRNQGLDFEIVLVCLPFCRSIHPKEFQNIALCALKKHRVSNWWLFPFNNSACLRLDHLSSLCYTESMIIVGPYNKFVDSQGGELVFLYGFHFGTQMYPFTMEALLQVFLQRLEAITIETFFPYDYVYQDYECDDSRRIPVAELKGKNVLVYVNSAECLRLPWTFETLDVAQWHDIIKEKDSDFEVVFVPVMNPVPPCEYPELCSKVGEYIFRSKAKWLVCPFDDPKHSGFLRNHDAFIFSCGLRLPQKGLPKPSVLAFGEDGHLHTLDALHLLRRGLDAYPFDIESRNLNLRDDITRFLIYEYDLEGDTTWSA